ncbi:hypothetical protein [Streptococcus sp. DD13]|uniref:hypothetical protein n=1 Tax=Streptococcus sp. DD13 TaxID=1777881 RepID=UPI00079269D5|nr:hypothetical protein [Streptococcus sp. DD13]KXT77992.1 hypothetical protein STRDD13_01149 [Streptococcus sp. DD13]
MEKRRFLTIICGISGLVSVFLPWISIDAFQLTMNVNGFGRGDTPTDAFVSLILFGLIVALSLIGERKEEFSPVFSYSICGLAVLSFIFGLVEFFAVHGKVATVDAQLRAVSEAAYKGGSVGYGVYISLVASLVVVILLGLPIVHHFQRKHQ